MIYLVGFNACNQTFIVQCSHLQVPNFNSSLEPLKYVCRLFTYGEHMSDTFSTSFSVNLEYVCIVFAHE